MCVGPKRWGVYFKLLSTLAAGCSTDWRVREQAEGDGGGTDFGLDAGAYDALDAGGVDMLAMEKSEDREGANPNGVDASAVQPTVSPQTGSPGNADSAPEQTACGEDAASCGP
ncbi:MAG: hypothetical protein RL385_6140, partial [Pseudomonadota bacterium]